MYFAKNTKHANTTKIFKLLNFFDFEHFRQTGYPAIGLEYETFERGPVPKKLWFQVKDGNIPQDFKKNLGININIRERRYNDDIVEYLFKAKSNPDLTVFSPREIKILDRLATIYQEANATQMSAISHSDEWPWSITMKEKGLYSKIDYMLALNSGEPKIAQELAQELLNEFFEITKDFQIEPV